MAITRIFWDGEGYDIHLLKGEKTIPLEQKLRGVLNNGTPFNGDALPSGVTREFQAEFKGAPSNHGVTVSDKGEVSVAGTLPTPRLFNFILRAKLSQAGSNSLETVIRIHIHEAIKTIWLTPDTLTLYIGAAQRFTVLAEFDDKTFGDITNRNSTIVLNTRNRLTFKRVPSATNNVTVDATTGALTVATPDASQEIRVEILLDATTPELPDEQQSGATVNTKPLLGAPRKIERIRAVGPANFANKTNFLFLPDGFKSGETDEFNKIVDQIVLSFQDGDATIPYKLLKDSINYWRLQDADFVGSHDQGVSVLAELHIVGRRTSSGKLVPFPLPPSASTSQWAVEHLVYKIGLPVPGDARTMAQLKTLYDGILDSRISSTVLTAWRALGDRKLINERDTAFGMALNNHPRVDFDGDPLSTFHDRRTTAGQFRSFVEALVEGSTAVGTTWTTGKDHGLVCVVARSLRNGGTNADDAFCFTLDEQSEDRLQPATGGRRGVDPIPMDLAKAGKIITISPAIIRTVAHECAHSFKLSDEYGGGFQLPSAKKISLIGVGNVQPASEIQQVLTSLETDLIRWKLPRIKAAGVLTAAPVASGSNFTITLVTVRAGDFKKDDVVRLRKRDFLRDTTLNSGPFKVQDVQLSTISINPFSGTSIAPGEFPGGSQLFAENSGTIGVTTSEPVPSIFFPGGSILDVDLRSGHTGGFVVGNVVRLRKSAFSDRFKVTADPSGNQLTIAPIGASTLVASLFGAGDVLIATVPASVAPLGDDLPLIAPTVLKQLGTSNGPLNAPRGNPTRACVAQADFGSVMTPTNVPSGLPKGRPANKANIVGLYEGGKEFDCGIFHPAGLCIMRVQLSDKNARFCHVCRYLIVDRVDPIFHKELDNLYAAEYPEP